MTIRRLVSASLGIAVLSALVASAIGAQRLDPIVYTIRIPQPQSQFVEIEAAVPTGGRRTLEIMMPIWSPGYYRTEDYAANVQDLKVRTPDGVPLSSEKSQKNRWRVQTGGAPAIVVSYRVHCAQRSVTTNWVGEDYAVLNGAPTFVTLAEQARRPHEIQINLPVGWTHAMTGLDAAPGGSANRFRAADYETLVDSPILLGKLSVHEFDVANKKHFVVAAGDYTQWNATAGTRDLAAIVRETHRFWGFLPYEKYLFLLLFRQGGGGLEHRNSNLSTVRAEVSERTGRWSSLGLLSHEYFHLFNAKRLRPIELGPFDFEAPPTTGSLWIAEGLTSYFSDLMIVRAGLQSPEQYLASLSSSIERLQTAPGRLLQSVEQSSREVWVNSNSGVDAAATTVSYYNKGAVLGLLLDAKIRRTTDGRRSLDDVLRLAYKRHSGDRGFTAEEFRLATEDVAGVDLREWFRRSVSSTEELDYTDVLQWFGLRFRSPAAATGAWLLEMRGDATEAQKHHLNEWLHRP